MSVVPNLLRPSAVLAAPRDEGSRVFVVLSSPFWDDFAFDERDQQVIVIWDDGSSTSEPAWVRMWTEWRTL